MATAPGLEVSPEGPGWLDRALCVKGSGLCCVISGGHCRLIHLVMEQVFKEPTHGWAAALSTEGTKVTQVEKVSIPWNLDSKGGVVHTERNPVLISKIGINYD